MTYLHLAWSRRWTQRLRSLPTATQSPLRLALWRSLYLAGVIYG